MSLDANAEYSHKDHNYTMLQAFEWYVEGGGKHWKKLEEEVPRLSDIGITAMWLPPPTKASNPVRSPCTVMPGGVALNIGNVSLKDSVGYDTYDLYDLVSVLLLHKTGRALRLTTASRFYVGRVRAERRETDELGHQRRAAQTDQARARARHHQVGPGYTSLLVPHC